MPVSLVSNKLYDEDFVAWLEEQAGHLRAARLAVLDLPNLAEELEDMGRSERRELDSRLEILIAHLLKKDIQPEAYTRSWDATINEQRRALRRLLESSPSLVKTLAARVPAIYPDARARAVDETGLAAGKFPKASPYAVGEVMGDASVLKGPRR
jgi:hypothetical protein